MADKQEKLTQANPLPDLVGMILAPLVRPASDPRPATTDSKQKSSPRDKQFRGGKNKGR